MTPEERLVLTRSIPPDLTPEDVVARHGNAMQGPNDPCWYVSIRGKAVPGFYSPEDAAKLRAQILKVSYARKLYPMIKAGFALVSADGVARCPFCKEESDGGAACAPCIEAYQLEYKAPVVDPADDSDILYDHTRC